MDNPEELFISPRISDEEVSRLSDVMSGKTTLKLNSYKLPCVKRCVARRMTSVGAESFDGYMDKLAKEPSELEGLISEITVEYSSFFRDPEVFKVIRECVFPEIVDGKLEKGSNLIRIWSAGCATGEEAYSISIMANELLSTFMERFTVMIFATDVDKSSTRKAIDGRYSVQSLENIDRAKIDRYFSREGGRYVVRRNVRKDVFFGVQDIIDDPPISHLDLLLCRNVLIYLNRDSQTKVLRKLHYALEPGGILVLGKAETISREVSQLFEVIDRQCKVFRKLPHAEH